MAPTNAQIWSGGLRLVYLVIVAILLFSICVIVPGAEYVKQVTTPPHGYASHHTYGDRHYWENGSIYVTKPIFYACTMAFLSIAHSALNLIVPHFTTLSPLYLILTSFIFVLGWLAQWGIWMDCEIVSIYPSRSRPTCPQSYLASNRRNNFLSGIPPSETNMRVIFGGVALVLYLALFVWSIAGQVRKRTIAKRDRLAKANNEGEGA
ncbi:MAG: hypothetical protein M1835_004893 [Candelina submexicana]|nr:MAG: hypothetical protein M1835_004893 [Candelina submexicana]